MLIGSGAMWIWHHLFTNVPWVYVLVALTLLFSLTVLVLQQFTQGYTKRKVPIIDTSVYYPYGVFEMQGKRPYMEDRHDVRGLLKGNRERSFYGVFDGHGGPGAAEFCAERLCRSILDQPMIEDNVRDAMIQGFIQVDAEYVRLANVLHRDDGTTAVAVLVDGDRILVANAGDSRAVLIQNDGYVVPLSVDHKPNRADEQERIEKLGGSVVFWGVWRVEGVLAVSRAIGDRMLKAYVTGEPEVQEWTRTDDDSFIVVASDGIWDVLSNEDASRIILNAKCPQTASEDLVQAAYAQGSTDNICALVIDLRPRLDKAASIKDL